MTTADHPGPSRRRFIPRVFTGLRARLVLGFLVVVAIALALFFATVPRLLDGYFAQQSADDLQLRSGQAKVFVSQQLAGYVLGLVDRARC